MITVTKEQSATDRPPTAKPSRQARLLVLMAVCDKCKAVLPFRTAKEAGWFIGIPPKGKSGRRRKTAIRCQEHIPKLWLKKTKKGEKTCELK